MGTLTHLATAGKPRVSAAEEHGAIVVRIESAGSTSTSDELRSIARLAEEWGLERKGLEAAIRRANIPTARVGRQTVVRKSDVLRLVESEHGREEAAPVAPAAEDAPASYEALVAVAKRGRR